MLAEAGVELKTQGLKELLDGLKGVATSMTEVQKAVDIMQSSFTKAQAAIQPFGTQAQASMNQVQSAMKNVESAVKNMADATKQAVDKANTEIKKIFTDTENHSQKASKAAGDHWHHNLSNGVAAGMAKFEALKMAIQSVVNMGKSVAESGKEKDEILSQLLAGSKSKEEYEKNAAGLDPFLRKSLRGDQTVKQLGEMYLDMVKEFQGAEVQDQLKQVREIAVRASSVYGVDADKLWADLYSATKAMVPEGGAKQLTAMTDLLQQMGQLASNVKNPKSYKEMIDGVQDAVELSVKNAWPLNELLAVLASGGQKMLTLIKFAGRGGGLAKGFVETYKSAMQDLGLKADPYHSKEALEAQHKLMGQLKGDDREKAQSIYERMVAENKARAERTQKQIEAKTSKSPYAIFDLIKTMTDRYKSMNLKLDPDEAKATKKASEQVAAALGMSGMRAQRFISEINKAMTTGSTSARKLAMDVALGIMAENEGKGYGDVEKEKERLQLLDNKWKETKVAYQNMERSILAVLSKPITSILDATTKSLSKSAEEIMGQSDKLGEKLEAMVLGFRKVFDPEAKGGMDTYLVDLIKHLNKLDAIDFENFGTRVGNAFERAGKATKGWLSALEAIGKALSFIMETNAWIRGDEKIGKTWKETQKELANPTNPRMTLEEYKEKGLRGLNAPSLWSNYSSPVVKREESTPLISTREAAAQGLTSPVTHHSTQNITVNVDGVTKETKKIENSEKLSPGGDVQQPINNWVGFNPFGNQR